MAIATNSTPTLSQQPTTVTATQQQISIMGRFSNWLQQILVGIFSLFAPSREQLPPPQSAGQTSPGPRPGRIYDNDGDALSLEDAGPVTTTTNIRSIRSPDKTSPINLPEGVSRLYRNRGMVLEAKRAGSINSTTNIG